MITEQILQSRDKPVSAGYNTDSQNLYLTQYRAGEPIDTILDLSQIEQLNAFTTQILLIKKALHK